MVNSSVATLMSGNPNVNKQALTTDSNGISKLCQCKGDRSSEESERVQVTCEIMQNKICEKPKKA